MVLILSLPMTALAQAKPKLIFKEGDTLRLNSDGKKMVDVTLTLLVPKDRDTANNKKNYAIQDSLKNGTLLIRLDKSSNADDSKISLSQKTEFKMDLLEMQNMFFYTLRVPRDSLDDKTVVLTISAKNSKGFVVSGLEKKFVIYIKPLVPDTLSSNGKYEWWFHAGTNFDVFDGVKAQEFFFRANVFFRISDKFYGQTAFYKNRYFGDGQNNDENLNFNTVKRPVGFGDSLTVLTSGRYKRTTKQTTDPLAWQLDLLYKIKEDQNSSFFLSGGWDISTTTVRVENSYTYLDTTFRVQTSRPDTIRGANNFGTTNFPGSLKYQKPAYNFNIGFMWIYNDDTVNIKSQLTAGMSSFTNLTYVEETRNYIRYNFEGKVSPYLQMRIIGTYKPLGVSFGMESFIRKAEYPAFNFTLSKAFDLRKLVSNFTPVSALKVK